MPDTAVPINGASSLHDLLALSDEQILEIDPEAQDVEISSDHPDASEFDDLIATAPRRERTGSRRDDFSRHGIANTQTTGATSEASRPSQHATQDASHGLHSSIEAQHAGPQLGKNSADQADESSPNAAATGHGVSTSSPPQWLADRMSDPQHGTEARELWNSSQLARQSEQARQEAAAFREVFAKPDDARAAAQRARLLDDIDRAYFTGDATQRASLAASMLREDPAAFREMVFAGLRALEHAGQGHASIGQSSSSNATGPDTTSAQQSTSSRGPAAVLVGAQHAAPQLGTISAAEHSTAQASTNHSPGSTTQDAAALAAYIAFERGANEDLERNVGTTIDRTLDQALPHAAGRADSAAMKTRLAATIRQDVERALQGDRQLGEQVAQILSARRFDNEARASVVRLIGERAQQLVPGSAKRILSEWTQTTLAAHRGQRDRSDAAATRREVAPADTSAATQSAAAPRAAATAASSQRSSSQRTQDTQRRQSAAPLARSGSSRGIDYRLSDEQILDL